MPRWQIRFATLFPMSLPLCLLSLPPSLCLRAASGTLWPVGGAGPSACTPRCCSARTDLAPSDWVPLLPQCDLADQIAVLVPAHDQAAQHKPSRRSQQIDGHDAMPGRVEVVQGGHPAGLLAAGVIAVKLAHTIQVAAVIDLDAQDRKSTRLNSSHANISYA